MSRFLPLFILVGSAWMTNTTWSQVDSTSAENGWWKGLFRPAEQVAPAPATSPSDSEVKKPTAAVSTDVCTMPEDSLVFENQRPLHVAPATFSWTLPTGLAALDSMDKANPKPLEGHRIQIYFGDLQEARAVRAAFRREHPNVACQLVPITPNYAVTVGNYRDVWSAQRALRDGDVGTWQHALVIPSTIDLPSVR